MTKSFAKVPTGKFTFVVVPVDPVIVCVVPPTYVIVWSLLDFIDSDAAHQESVVAVPTEVNAPGSIVERADVAYETITRSFAKGALSTPPVRPVKLTDVFEAVPNIAPFADPTNTKLPGPVTGIK